VEDDLVFRTIQPSDVPAFTVVEARAKSISSEISVSEIGFDFDNEVYRLRFTGPNGRHADVDLSRELLDDLRDNPASPSGKYTLELTAELDAKLLEAIEVSGLISFGEESLKFLLLKFVSEERKNGRPLHKYNTIGRGAQGEFERWLGRDLTPDEKDSLIWTWDELIRLRLIAPTGTDLVATDSWIKLTDRGAAAVEGKTFTEYAEVESFISKGEVYSAFRTLQRILRQARSEVIIIDPYVDEQVLDLIAAINPHVEVQLVTEHLRGIFAAAYRKLLQQRGNLEARVAAHFHDRFVILDRAVCYQLGSSINNLGSKATVIDRKSNTVRDKILSEVAAVWAQATPL
jgi:hypothetical protein